MILVREGRNELLAAAMADLAPRPSRAHAQQHAAADDDEAGEATGPRPLDWLLRRARTAADPSAANRARGAAVAESRTPADAAACFASLMTDER
jgi:hypothetical protein